MKKWPSISWEEKIEINKLFTAGNAHLRWRTESIKKEVFRYFMKLYFICLIDLVFPAITINWMDESNVRWKKFNISCDLYKL
jgi:hypothetical protein